MIRERDRPAISSTGDADEKFFAAVEGLRRGLDAIQERWDNRLILEETPLWEGYICGRFEILLYGNWGAGADHLNFVCRIAADAAVPHGVGADAGVDVANLGEGDGWQDESVFVGVIESADGAECLSIPVRVRFDFIPDEDTSIGEGLLYRLVGGLGFKVFNIVPKRHRESTRGICCPECLDRGGGPVIEAGAQVVDDISDDQRKMLRDWLFGDEAKVKNIRLTKECFRPFTAQDDIVQITGKDGGVLPDGIKVALGPFNL